MDKEGREELDMVGEQTEYEMEMHGTETVADTMATSTGRAGTKPITLSDIAKEDKPDLAMDMEDKEEMGMVGEQIEYEMKKETSAETLTELTGREGTKPITLSDNAKEDKPDFAMDREDKDEVGMVGEQTEYEMKTETVAGTLGDLTGREGIEPITLGDKTAKEDKPDQVMDREGGEESDMVGEQTKFETEIVTSQDRSLNQTRKKN